MFIRYNEALDFWEYDTSASQTGAGPWVLLPIDASKLIVGPALGNIAYTNVKNLFTQPQLIESGITDIPYLGFRYLAGAVDAKNSRFEGVGNFKISHTNDADNVYLKEFVFGRDGHVYFPGTTYSKEIEATGTTGGVLRSRDTGAPVNSRVWVISGANDGLLYFQCRTDAEVAQVNAIKLQRNGVVEFPGAHTVHHYGAYFPYLSSNVGLLDDYEEGSFTPILFASNSSGQGTSYSTQQGRYTKIGNVVTAMFDLTIQAANWTSGACLLGGFPIPNGEFYTVGHFEYYTINGVVYSMQLHMQPGSYHCYIPYKTSLSSTAHDNYLDVSNIMAGSAVRGTMIYRTNNA